MTWLTDTILRLAGPLVLVVVFALPALEASTVGYAIGRRMGERLLAHLPHRLVDPRQVERAAALVRRLGGRAVLVGRFTAALRTLVPGLAGLAGVPYRTFAAYSTHQEPMRTRPRRGPTSPGPTRAASQRTTASSMTVTATAGPRRPRAKIARVSPTRTTAATSQPTPLVCSRYGNGGAAR